MIIGICGPLGSGKSTIATMFQAFGEFEILPFAKPVKDFAYKLGWDGQKDEKGRRLLQLLGTDCGRECIDPDIWITHWKSMIFDYRMIFGKKLDIIADDLRFENEANMIKEHDGIIIEVLNRGQYNNSHPSEVGVPKHIKRDYIIHNDGSLDHLKNEVKEIMNGLQQK